MQRRLVISITFTVSCAVAFFTDIESCDKLVGRDTAVVVEGDVDDAFQIDGSAGGVVSAVASRGPLVLLRRVIHLGDN